MAIVESVVEIFGSVVVFYIFLVTIFETVVGIFESVVAFYAFESKLTLARPLLSL